MRWLRARILVTFATWPTRRGVTFLRDCGDLCSLVAWETATLHRENGDYLIRLPNRSSTGKLVTLVLNSIAVSRGIGSLC